MDDEATEQIPNAYGHFMVTILKACDLFVEGMPSDRLNVYDDHGEVLL